MWHSGKIKDITAAIVTGKRQNTIYSTSLTSYFFKLVSAALTNLHSLHAKNRNSITSRQKHCTYIKQRGRNHKHTAINLTWSHWYIYIYIYTTFYYFWVLFNQSIFPQILQVKLSPHPKGLPKKNLGLLMQDFLQARYLSSETTNSVVSCRDINIQCVHEEGRDITLPQSWRLYRNMKINESQMFCD